MPIYEFACPACATEFEELVRRPEDATSMRCPNCGGGKVTKKLSWVALNLGQGSPAGYTEARVAEGATCGCGGSCSLS